MRVIAPALLLVLTLTLPAEGVLFNLTQEQVAQAIAHGKETYAKYRQEGRSIDDLDPEYVVDLGPELGRAMLFTEFSAVAVEARRFMAIGRELGPGDVEFVLSSLRGWLRFSVVATGNERDFLRQSAVRLVQPKAKHEPSGWDVFKGQPLAGTPPRFVAQGQYNFAAKGVDPESEATLIVTDSDGRELKFSFDLGRLR